ncbi:unnamed protein product [Cylicocyclus nassatus]|uniref:Serpentine receptor class gamma n=1 Tax=Cylicocyclus nassatus TaxID=53992 RepID=A0AA36DRA8_CYLNA|nr:unnamed protein product [Cylicocyclus nassatus]
MLFSVFNIALVFVGIITIISFFLTCVMIVILWRYRKSTRYKAFFYKTLWNECIFNIFTFIFFLATMYARFFDCMIPIFLYLNRFPWWTKFAQITQEHIMYIQTMNVFLAVGGRFCTVCIPHSRITHTAEELNKWMICVLQIFLPTIVEIPIYIFYNFEYGYTGNLKVPLLLGTTNDHYYEVAFSICVIYLIGAFALCVFGYISLFYTVRKRANRNETNIIIHGGCLLLALGALSACTIVRGFRILEKSKYMRIFYFSTSLWIPCTNIAATICVIGPIRKHILAPFKEKADTTVLPNTTLL